MVVWGRRRRDDFIFDDVVGVRGKRRRQSRGFTGENE